MGHAFARPFLLGPALLLGGTSATTGRLSDAWLFDHATNAWSAQPSGPFAVTGHAIAHDDVSGKFVMFGGDAGLPLPLLSGMTLTFDPATGVWAAPPITAPVPAARADFAMVSVLFLQVPGGPPQGSAGCVLFGGATAAGPVVPPKTDDTWFWDGATGQWSLLHGGGPTAPPVRSHHSMSYNAVSNRVVLFGGLDTNNNPLGDTWTFDGSVWTQVASPTSPSARSGAAMTHDPFRGVDVLHGGRSMPGGTPTLENDTWEFSGATWLRRGVASPSAGRELATAVFDYPSQDVLMFGGTTVVGLGGETNQIWQYAPLQPSLSFVGTGCAGSAGTAGLSFNPGIGPFLGAAFEMKVSPVPNIMNGGVFFEIGPLAVPPVNLGPLGMPGCTGYVNATDSYFVAYSNDSVASFTLGVPFDMALDGQSFVVQVLVGDPGWNAFGAVVSDAWLCTIQ